MIARRVFLKSALYSAAALPLSLTAPAIAADEKKVEAPKTTAPKVEIVFCLDTTGSMGGLIEGAKQKIWAICNQVAGGKPSPDLKVGLVGYRDRKDAYITKVFDLSEDLDAIHGHLKGFQAQGGGDTPESVNEAIHDAVNKVKWSTGDDVLKILFLVGDAPPHMDYPDDVKYPVTCEKACKMGIIINTVQCGTDQTTTKFWKEIAGKSEGQYVQIAQDGGVVAIATPFDKRLSEINGELTKSTVCYGTVAMQAESKQKADDALKLAATAAAERAAFNSKKEQNAHFDLLDAVRQNRVKLEEIKKDQLPPEMQKMTLAEQKAHLEKIEKQRAELHKEAIDLDKKRSEFIAKKLAETKGKDGFDQQVLEMLRKQAKKVKIEY